MIILKRFLQAFVSSFLLLATLSPAAEEPVCCLPPETDVGMYDFVPEAQLQASDFRPLMKTEHAFMSAMMQPASINLIDFTTPIPSIEIMPQAPALSGVLQPPPADSHTTYFFVGTITKKDAGFLLKVQLKKSSDSSLGNVSFKGTQEIFAVRKHPYNYVHKFDDYTEGMGGSGSTKITPQMTKSGVYTFTITDKTH